MKKRLILALGILLFFGFFAVNCSAQSSSNALIGKWVSENGEHVFEFFKDGSGIWIEDGYKVNIKWKATENGVFTITLPHTTEEWDYKISGSVLTFDNTGYKNALVLNKSK